MRNTPSFHQAREQGQSTRSGCSANMCPATEFQAVPIISGRPPVEAASPGTEFTREPTVLATVAAIAAAAK